MEQYSPFPNRILSAEKKDDKYTLAMAKAIYYNYDMGSDYVNRAAITRFNENRLYGEGRQPEDKYVPMFSLDYDNKTMQRKGLENIDFSIVPFAPLLRNSTIQLLSARANRVNVVFLNDIASDERVNKKLSMQFDIENEDFVKQMDEVRGTTTKKEESAPETVSELEMLDEIGGIKLDVEVALEMGIDYVMNYEAQWEDKLAHIIKGNLFDNNFAVVSMKYNPVTQDIRVRVHNIENIIIDGGEEEDYQNAQYFGEIVTSTLIDVYKEIKETTGKEITEDELKSLALTTFDIDFSLYNNEYFESVGNRDILGLMPNKIRVLDFVYLSTDVLTPKGKEKVYLNPDKVGEKELETGKVAKDENGYYKNVKSNKQIEVPVWRRGKWLIDTNIVYDYGLVFNQVRDARFKPMRPFHAVRLHGKSIMEIIKPNLDALQMDMLKLQSLKNEMKGKGLAINFDALDNIKMGKNDYSIPKLLTLYKLKGTLLYKNTNNQSPIGQSGAFPIQELEGGMGEAYNQIMADIQFNIQQIQLNSGLNEVALSQSPNPEVTYGQAQMAMSGANNSIAHIYRAYKYLKEEVAFSIALRLHNIAKKDESTKYRNIVGKSLWNALAETSEDFIMREGITIIDAPTQEEVQMLYQNMAKLAPNTLTSYDLFLIESMIKEGKPLKYIAALMETKIRKREQEALASQKQMMEQNAASQQQMIAQQAQYEQMLTDIKLKAKQMEVEFDKVAELAIQADKFTRQSQLDKENDEREAKLFKEPYRNNA